MGQGKNLWPHMRALMLCVLTACTSSVSQSIQNPASSQDAGAQRDVITFNATVSASGKSFQWLGAKI